MNKRSGDVLDPRSARSGPRYRDSVDTVPPNRISNSNRMNVYRSSRNFQSKL